MSTRVDRALGRLLLVILPALYIDAPNLGARSVHITSKDAFELIQRLRNAKLTFALANKDSAGRRSTLMSEPPIRCSFRVRPDLTAAALCVFMCMLVAFAPPTLGQETLVVTPDNSLSEEYKFLLAGLVSEREQLRSGVVTVTQQVAGKAHPDRAAVASSTQSTVTFDFDQSKLRVDRLLGNDETTYIRTRDFAASAAFNGEELEGGVVEKTPPDVEPLSRFGVFDIRKIGLVTALQLLDNRHSDLGLARITNLLAEQKLMSLEKAGDVYVVTTRIEKLATERKMWIDTSRGYAPIRFELRFVPNERKSTLLHNCETNWEKIDDIWLPVQFVDTDRDGLRTELAFSWRDVNKTPQGRLFTTESLNVSGSQFAMFVDSRIDPPLIERIVRTDLVSGDGGKAGPNWRSIFVVLNAISAAILILFLIRRRRRTAN